jgi:hypothetical protein
MCVSHTPAAIVTRLTAFSLRYDLRLKKQSSISATLYNQMVALATDEIHACFGVRIKKRATRVTVERVHITAARNKRSCDYYYYYYYYY